MNEERLKQIELLIETLNTTVGAAPESEAIKVRRSVAETLLPYVPDLLTEVRRLRQEMLWAAALLYREGLITRTRGAELCGMGWQEFNEARKEVEL